MVDTLFETARLGCRHLDESDLAALYEVYSDPLAMRWVGDGSPISRPECKAWLTRTLENYANRGYGMFALVEHATGQVIGFAGLVHPDDQAEAEIKYAFLRSYWGQGFASEIVRALLEAAQNQFGLDLVIATVAPENRASQRVLEKAGAVDVGLQPGEELAGTRRYEWRSARTGELSVSSAT
ncbi:N-acetyltransferase [Mangrovimicrobium sediminis]|uniref:N-acetyltransferase n=1 Tax=Mangrovimicrobium sediminis TaxID=2562682 RepID=A0A4Z0M717_9GAMM|nr:GNAT family N-acetyltransferase [Haliea sp. SAOS-164]TGD75299.1 N-acetyltransferase [Haliea sp. SAOS-164]